MRCVKPQIVSEKSARYSREHVGNGFIGWLHVQTIYDQLVATQPGMFDSTGAAFHRAWTPRGRAAPDGPRAAV